MGSFFSRRSPKSVEPKESIIIEAQIPIPEIIP
jgi:hypothetical protein